MKKGIYGKLVFLGVVLCILAVMLVISCGKTTTTPTKTTAASPTPTPTPTPKPTSTGLTPQYGGVLHILAGTGQDNVGAPAVGSPPFNPFIPAPCVEGLMIRDNAGNPSPWLCESWDLDRTAMTLTLHLVHGVTFQDGSPFNAEAAKWNMENLIASGQGELPHVASIDVLDDYTVRVNMATWDILMANYFVLKAGNMISQAAVQQHDMNWAVSNPVSTGPFKFESYTKDVNLKFTRYNNYWVTGKPYLDGIEWVYIADTMTRLAAFKAGEGEVITGLTAEQGDELKKSGQYDVTTSPSQIFALYPDSANPDSPWSNVLVRQAANYAINREAICKAFGYGFYQPTDQFGFPGYPMYNPDIKGYPYDPDKARKLLADAGYANGFDTTMWFASGGNDNIYTAIQGYWEAVGIHAQMQIVDFAKVLDVSTHGWNNGTCDFLPPFTPSGYPPAKDLTFSFSKASIFAVSVIRPDDIEALEQKALGADTVDEMNTICKEINRLLTDQYCVMIPIFVSPNIAAKVKWLHDDRIDDTWQEQWNPQDAWFEAPHNTGK
jgi:peptide/nickel transport system substrate-binding protein